MSERRRIVVVLTVCFLISFICMSVFNIAHAAPGLTQQISTNERANKIASATCGAWKPKMTKVKSDCRFTVLKRNGYVAILDSGEGTPDMNTIEWRRDHIYTPYALPISDSLAVDAARWH